MHPSSPPASLPNNSPQTAPGAPPQFRYCSSRRHGRYRARGSSAHGDKADEEYALHPDAVLFDIPVKGFNQLNRDEGVKENGEHISRLLPGDQKLRVAVWRDQHLAELAYKLHHFHGHVAHDDFGKDIEDQPLKLLLHPAAHNPMNLKGSAAGPNTVHHPPPRAVHSFT